MFFLVLPILNTSLYSQEIQYVDAQPGVNVEYFDSSAGVWALDDNIFTADVPSTGANTYSIVSSSSAANGDFIQSALGSGSPLPPLRLTFENLDPNLEYTFFVFTTLEDNGVIFSPGGARQFGGNGGVFFVSVLDDIGDDAIAPDFGQPGLFVFDARNNLSAGNQTVDANGAIVASGLSDRIRSEVGTFTGSSELGLYFRGNLGDAFSTFDGVGFAVSSAGEPVPVAGDFNNDGDVDTDDIDFYNGNLGEPASFNVDLDLNSDNSITLADHDLLVTTFVQTSNGVTGALIGDVDLNGAVDVLGDAFQLVENLGGVGSLTYSDGDLNADGNVDVLGDAFRLVANLGLSNLQ